VKQIEGRCQIFAFRRYLRRWSEGDGLFRTNLGATDAILATGAGETQGALPVLVGKSDELGWADVGAGPAANAFVQVNEQLMVGISDCCVIKNSFLLKTLLTLPVLTEISQ
jgi:hypothetical protein